MYLYYILFEKIDVLPRRIHYLISMLDALFSRMSKDQYLSITPQIHNFIRVPGIDMPPHIDNCINKISDSIRKYAKCICQEYFPDHKVFLYMRMEQYCGFYNLFTWAAEIWNDELLYKFGTRKKPIFSKRQNVKRNAMLTDFIMYAHKPHPHIRTCLDLVNQMFEYYRRKYTSVTKKYLFSP